MAAHATLGASKAERWLACPPSARLESEFPEKTSAYAEEGTLAHRLAELRLRIELGGNDGADIEEHNAFIEAEKISQEMIDAVDLYVGIVIEKINEAKARSRDAVIGLEQRLDFSEWVPDGFGTGDVVIVSDGVIEVIDLKYGKGVPVSAVNNPQLRLYGLGAYSRFDLLYGLNTVRTTIVQPRLDSISTEELTTDELLAWGESIRPIAELAHNGEGEFDSGDHCRFCKAKIHCRARNEKNLEAARHEFKDPALMKDDELAAILSIADELKGWASDLQGYALQRAIEGATWPGWKLVEGRRVRTYSDADKVAATLTAAGYPEAILYERSLLGISKMESAIGKKKFGEILSDLIITPPGKPALVPESDKRPALNSAAADFKEAAE